MKRLGKKKKNEKGMALLITLFAILMMTFLAVEIGYNTAVELGVSSAQVDRLKAYYLAKSGIQLSLLRIHVFRKATQQFGSTLGSNKSALDIIWQFPLAWPPALPPDASGFDKRGMEELVKESLIDGAFATSIEGEGSKIDVNDLSYARLREPVKRQLMKILQDRIDGEDAWAQRNNDLDPEEVVDNIIDWITPGDISVRGGSKRSNYGDTEPPYYPPQRPMKTIEELHLIKGVTDDVYDVIAPRLTVYGTKGINVNLASKDVLMSLDPQIDEEVVKEIIQRRSDQNLGGPFANEQDFVGYLQQVGVNPSTFNQDPKITLLFDSEYNFRIKSTGLFKKAQREIVAITYDFDKVIAGAKNFTPEEQKSEEEENKEAAKTAAQTEAEKKKAEEEKKKKEQQQAPPASQGPPRVVFWQEY